MAKTPQEVTLADLADYLDRTVIADDYNVVLTVHRGPGGATIALGSTEVSETFATVGDALRWLASRVAACHG